MELISSLESNVASKQDDFAVRPVAKSERRSVWDIALVTAGFCITTSDLFTGAAIATGVPLFQAIIAVLIGNTLLALYAGLIGAASAKYGVSTTLLARYAFGRSGAKVIGALAAITLLGWFAVQTGLFGQTVHASLGNLGLIADPKIAALWGGILMMQTAYIGYRGLALLSKIAIPALIVLAIWGMVDTVQAVGGWGKLFASQPSKPFSFTEAVMLTVGSFAVGAVVQGDISRYAKSQKDSWIGAIVGYVIANSFMIIAGIITSLATGSGDLPQAMAAAGMTLPAFFILIAAQWTTNDNNIYSASLGLSNVIKVKKSHIVLVGGIGASIIGYLGIVDYFIPWLCFLSILIPPVAGVMIADYYIVHKRKYSFGEGTRYSKVVWPAFVAWLAGILVAMMLPFGISSINAIVVAFATHIGLIAFCQKCNIAPRFGTAIEDREGF